MQKYSVEIIQKRTGYVEISANSKKEAFELAQKIYCLDGEVLPDMDDHEELGFEIIMHVCKGCLDEFETLDNNGFCQTCAVKANTIDAQIVVSSKPIENGRTIKVFQLPWTNEAEPSEDFIIVGEDNGAPVRCDLHTSDGTGLYERYGIHEGEWAFTYEGRLFALRDFIPHTRILELINSVADYCANWLDPESEDRDAGRINIPAEESLAAIESYGIPILQPSILLLRNALRHALDVNNLWNTDADALVEFLVETVQGFSKTEAEAVVACYMEGF